MGSPKPLYYTNMAVAVHALHNLYTLFALTQSRATNAPLFLLFRSMHFFLNALNLSPIEVTITSLLLQFTSFFAMGGSNAFTGIDLSSAYNGISGFNVFAVGALTFFLAIGLAPYGGHRHQISCYYRVGREL